MEYDLSESAKIDLAQRMKEPDFNYQMLKAMEAGLIKTMGGTVKIKPVSDIDVKIIEYNEV